jgi:hypothetical protein
MAKTYQTYLYGASFGIEENGRILDGWQVDRNNILFQSKEYENPTDAMQELNFHEPSHPNWFATMVEWTDGEVSDEQIFDSSLIFVDYPDY